MIKLLLALFTLLLTGFALPAADVLIVADEIPAMELLAAKLKVEEKLTCQVVKQSALPERLAGYAAVVVYIHLKLEERAEQAFIDYTRAGGQLVVLHHSISSGKRKNRDWFKFLGVSLPEGDVSQGGYKWTEGVTLQIVNLAPEHFITTNKVQYPAEISYARGDGGGGEEKLPGFELKESEVYLNHVLTEPRTLLLGVKYTDAKSGKTYMQRHAGWVRTAGKGRIVYLLPGHSAPDFENPAYARIVLNAIVYRP